MALPIEIVMSDNYDHEIMPVWCIRMDYTDPTPLRYAKIGFTLLKCYKTGGA